MGAIVDKIIGIIGGTKYISQAESEELKVEFGDEVGGKIYEMAGKGHRISAAEMVEIVKMVNDANMAKTKEIVAEVSDEMVRVVDIEQNKKLNAMHTKIGRLATGEMSYVSERIGALERKVKQYEADLIGLASRIVELENKE